MTLWIKCRSNNWAEIITSSRQQSRVSRLKFSSALQKFEKLAILAGNVCREAVNVGFLSDKFEDEVDSNRNNTDG